MRSFAFCFRVSSNSTLCPLFAWSPSAARISSSDSSWTSNPQFIPIALHVSFFCIMAFPPIRWRPCGSSSRLPRSWDPDLQRHRPESVPWPCRSARERAAEGPCAAGPPAFVYSIQNFSWARHPPFPVPAYQRAFDPRKLRGRAPPLFDDFSSDPVPRTYGPRENDRGPAFSHSPLPPRRSTCAWGSGYAPSHRAYADGERLSDAALRGGERVVVSGRSIRPRNTTADRRKIPSWMGSEKRNFLSGYHIMKSVITGNRTGGGHDHPEVPI